MAAVLVAAAVTWTSALSAQQPSGHGRHGDAHGGDKQAEMMQRHAREMDSLDARLDGLVERMNRSSGSAQVTAMAAVTELAAQRRAMHAHHRGMMRHHST